MTYKELDRSFEDLYQDCVKNLGEPDKALLYLQKMRSKYNADRRAPSPLKRWTAEDGTPPDAIYLTEISPFGFAIEVRTEEIGPVVYLDDNELGLISIPLNNYWENNHQMFGPIEAEKIEMKKLDGPYNEKFCNNPHAPEVCRHNDLNYKCLKFNAELAMACVDPTPEKFYPAAVRCAACLAEGGAE